MKKYIVTDKHPELQEGIELIDMLDGDRLQNKEGTMIIYAKSHLLIKEEIKEIQEPKWTDDDMIDFSRFILKQIKTDLTYEPTDNEWIEKWQNDRNK